MQKYLLIFLLVWNAIFTEAEPPVDSYLPLTQNGSPSTIYGPPGFRPGIPLGNGHSGGNGALSQPSLSHNTPLHNGNNGNNFGGRHPDSDQKFGTSYLPPNQNGFRPGVPLGNGHNGGYGALSHPSLSYNTPLHNGNSGNNFGGRHPNSDQRSGTSYLPPNQNGNGGLSTLYSAPEGRSDFDGLINGRTNGLSLTNGAPGKGGNGKTSNLVYGTLGTQDRPSAMYDLPQHRHTALNGGDGETSSPLGQENNVANGQRPNIRYNAPERGNNGLNGGYNSGNHNGVSHNGGGYTRGETSSSLGQRNNGPNGQRPSVRYNAPARGNNGLNGGHNGGHHNGVSHNVRGYNGGEISSSLGQTNNGDNGRGPSVRYNIPERRYNELKGGHNGGSHNGASRNGVSNTGGVRSGGESNAGGDTGAGINGRESKTGLIYDVSQQEKNGFKKQGNNGHTITAYGPLEFGSNGANGKERKKITLGATALESRNGGTGNGQRLTRVYGLSSQRSSRRKSLGSSYVSLTQRRNEVENNGYNDGNGNGGYDGDEESAVSIFDNHY